MAKNKTQNQTKNSPPPNAADNQPKKSNACLPLAIVGIIFFLLISVFLFIWMWPFIFSFLMDLRSRDFSLPKTFETAKGTLKGKNLASLVDPSKTITKRITAKNGGQITAQTASGLYFTLNIAPGSLEKDTDISITPINESPIENYPDPTDPGVVIGPAGTNLGSGSSVSVSGNPPSGGSGTQPGTGAGGGTTPTPPTTPPGTPPGTSGDIPDLGSLADLLGNNASMTAPSETSPGQGAGDRERDRERGDGNEPVGSWGGQPRFSDTAVIIFVGYGGGVSTVPTEPSDDGDEISGPIDETGAASTDDPTEEESEGITDNAAANSGAASGGACTGEYIEALARTIAAASRAGDTAAVSRYESEIRRCNDESADHLKYLCDHNPIQLRRKDFENRLALARALPASSGTASEIERLMNECQNKYRFRGEGTIPEAAAYGIMLLSSLDAEVCGFLDDEWMGTQTYEMSPEPNTAHTFEGKTKFRLPPNGGQFSGTSHVENSFVVIGRGVAIPDLRFWIHRKF